MMLGIPGPRLHIYYLTNIRNTVNTTMIACCAESEYFFSAQSSGSRVSEKIDKRIDNVGMYVVLKLIRWIRQNTTSILLATKERVFF
jgi:hypothetical protein